METYSIESFVENKHMMRDKRLGNSSRVSTAIKSKTLERNSKDYGYS